MLMFNRGKPFKLKHVEIAEEWLDRRGFLTGLLSNVTLNNDEILYGSCLLNAGGHGLFTAGIGPKGPMVEQLVDAQHIAVISPYSITVYHVREIRDVAATYQNAVVDGHNSWEKTQERKTIQYRINYERANTYTQLRQAIAQRIPVDYPHRARVVTLIHDYFLNETGQRLNKINNDDPITPAHLIHADIILWFIRELNDKSSIDDRDKVVAQFYQTYLK